MEVNKETKENKEKIPVWKLFTLLAGGGILLIIMVRSMQESYAMLHDQDAKGKSVSKGPAVPISANSLQTAYALYTDSTTKMYRDKILLVNGKIGEVDKYHTGEAYIIFEKSEAAANVKIECLFKKEASIDSLSKGRYVSVEGAVNFMKDVILIDNAQVKK
jgi:tRNA_anti-like